MVRIKHRYLLVNILYPDKPSEIAARSEAINRDAKPLPDIVQFHQPTPDEVTPQLLLRTVREHIALLYGDYGAGVTTSGLSVKYFSPATSTFILRAPRTHFRLVWAALTMMTHLPKPPKSRQSRECVMRVVRVSGTIRKSEEEAIRRARANILKAKRDTSDGKAGVGELGALEALLAAVDDDDEVVENVGDEEGSEVESDG